VTMTVPVAAFSAVWFCSDTIPVQYVVRSAIGLLSDSYVSLIFLAHIRFGKFATGQCIVRPPDKELDMGRVQLHPRVGLGWVGSGPIVWVCMSHPG